MRFQPLFRLAIAALLAVVFFGDGLFADETKALTAIPSSVRLTHREDRQTLLAQWAAGQEVMDQAADATLVSADPAVAKIDGAMIVPVADGKTTITVSARDASGAESKSTVEVEVVGQGAPFQWSFRNHVESVLSKQGCNGGACHGARAGQKGFRLTLFGYDLDADYNYLTRHAGGRRVVLSDPGRSLLLTKPTGLLPHKGGVRLEPDSLEYRVLAEWIGAGAPGPKPGEVHVESIEVAPPVSRQSPGKTQQLVVLAKYSDGTADDVTRWAKFTSTNNSVATVDNLGKTTIAGHGEGAIKVWYQNLNAVAVIRAPYPNVVADAIYAQAPRSNFIDELTLEKLCSLNLEPAPLCDDGAFLRRVYLDSMGVLPTVEETRAFLADTSSDKREKVVNAILARPEFVDYWAYKWSDVLLATGDRLRPQPLQAYYDAIRKSVADNEPWDLFVRRVVTASGSTVENGLANFYSLHQDPEDMAETVSQAFMGLSINCAKCHNHPLEKWTNDQYYGMANLFARVRAKGWAGDFRSGDGVRVIYSDIRGELLQPSQGKPQPPRPLDASPIPFDDESDRRETLAAWLTSPENPYFARSIANRVWASFLGVGLVEKVDDLRVTNPASNERLLAALAKRLIDDGYDLRKLMREIMLSATYQRSGDTTPTNRDDEMHYARYYPKRMKAEVLLDALSQVSGTPTEFKDKPKGTRALQLADSSVVSYFLDTFGRPQRKVTCDCERSDEPSMSQVLHLYNGDTLNGKLRAKGGLVERWMTTNAAPEAVVEELYLAAYSRMPTADETALLATVLRETPEAEKRLALEDLAWSVLSSREFLFNH